MPELPEVHTISSDLRNNIKGMTIDNITIIGDYKVLPSREEFLKKTLNQKIVDVQRIAKNIRIMLASGDSIVVHLAMTGQMLLRSKEHKPDNWVRVIFALSDKTGIETKTYQLRFCDMRMFGKVAVVEEVGIKALHDKYGPEPIHESTTPEIFHNKLRSKRTTIKNALLDQAIISGLGNIYATDALFMANVHPETSTLNLTPEQAQRLLEASKLILLEGIEHRGSTLDDRMYVDAFGKEGVHQNFFRIYGKAKCPTCGSVVSVIKINGRGTYFCPVCQPLNNQKSLF